MEKASTADMVKDAIKTLGERSGSSLHNIKKYIEAVYQVDMRYRAPRIRKFLRGAVSDGGVVQTTGRGASGSFKLPPVKPKQHAPAAAPTAAPARPRAAPAASSRASRASSTASTATSAPSSPRSSPSASSVASSVASAASSRIARDERAKARESKR